MYITVVLFFPYVLLVGVVGRTWRTFHVTYQRRPVCEGFYDCQRAYEGKEFVRSSSMSLYRYSMSLHNMEANGELELRRVLEGAGKSRGRTVWRTGAAFASDSSTTLEAAWLNTDEIGR